MVDTSCTAVEVMYAMSPVADSSVRSMGAVPSSVSCSSCPYRKAPAEVLTFAADRVLLPKISASCQCRSEDEKPLFQKHHISPHSAAVIQHSSAAGIPGQ